MSRVTRSAAMQASFWVLDSVSPVSNGEKTQPRAQGPHMYDTKPRAMTSNLYLAQIHT